MRKQLLIRCSALAAMAVTHLGAGATHAGLNGEVCLSDNNTAYFVLKTNDARTRVTSVAFAADAANACVENSSETVQTAVVVGGQALPSMVRTGVLANFATNANVTGSCSPPAFDSSAAAGFGILTLPNGQKVSANPGHTDCGGTCLAVLPVSSADATVPAAQEINTSRFAQSGAVTTCQVSGNTLVFPSPATTSPTLSDGRINLLDATDLGEVASQEATLDDTNGSVVGNPASQSVPDGFVLRGTCTGSPASTCQMIVFMASRDGAMAFGYGAAGFVTDEDDEQTDTDGFGSNREFNTPPPPPPREAPDMGWDARAVLVLLLAALGVHALRKAARQS